MAPAPRAQDHGGRESADAQNCVTSITWKRKIFGGLLESAPTTAGALHAAEHDQRDQVDRQPQRKKRAKVACERHVQNSGDGLRRCGESGAASS
jgi:hypothetical protein